MTQVVLPNTITGGTPMVAAEVQNDLVAIRDVVNGGLEGGSGAAGNIKADGVTAREIQDAVLLRGVQAAGGVMQEGVLAAGDLKVSPGAGLVLNYATGTAYVTDDSGVVATNALVPAAITGASVTIAANASGNPRIDQIILTLSGWNAGTVSVLQGTATVGATLDNRTGAAALPAGAVRLADILMPNAFAGPFVQATHIRDRRPWARGAYVSVDLQTGDIALASGAIVGISSGLNTRLEVSGNPVELWLHGMMSSSGAGNMDVRLAIQDNGTDLAGTAAGSGLWRRKFNGDTSVKPATMNHIWTPAAGSHNIVPTYWVSTDVGTIFAAPERPLRMVIREHVVQNANNSGA